ncbi:hypothetical protein AVENP_0452 [Arcobacter venerupis]|uniref:Uncharacterized protein n=1 Tax=Arcobacter venerupis TaxID=1054033 RepID=A0AAE7E3V6_9BACT|nr:hypothetical protein [Arcobacter venerupis]QKF66026.1 hypothetical protein AVENP_0452 [Arcobacter venerupis]RWS49382.1 hypothetical protein CKA56_09990 [Arcobacter venerupis]
MNTSSLISTLGSNSQDYSNSNKNHNVNKEKNDAFESLISSKTANEEKTFVNKENDEVIKEEPSTQSLYEDIISLLKTGFTVGELKGFEEKLKEILKMKDDNKSTNEEIETALKKLTLEIQEAKKRVSGQVIQKADENTTQSNNSAQDIGAFDFDTAIMNIKDMLQEIQNNPKNINRDDNSNEDKAYDKLKLLLKMS